MRGGRTLIRYISCPLSTVVHCTSIVHPYIHGSCSPAALGSRIPSLFLKLPYRTTTWYLATPNVLWFARRQIACDALTAVPLEDQGGSGSGSGSAPAVNAHWEQTLFAVRRPPPTSPLQPTHPVCLSLPLPSFFLPGLTADSVPHQDPLVTPMLLLSPQGDLMVSQFTSTLRITNLTLGFLADTGW